MNAEQLNSEHYRPEAARVCSDRTKIYYDETSIGIRLKCTSLHDIFNENITYFSHSLSDVQKFAIKRLHIAYSACCANKISSQCYQ